MAQRSQAEIDAVFADQLDVMATLSKDSNTLLATKPGGRTEKLSQSENSGGYWSEYWEQLPAQQRKVFRDDESAFIRSLAHYTCPMTSGASRVWAVLGQYQGSTRAVPGQH